MEQRYRVLNPTGLPEDRVLFNPRDLIMPPYIDCPVCDATELGTTTIGGNLIHRRCRSCLGNHEEVLPKLDKKVIYLDQMVISTFLDILHPEVGKGKRQDDWPYYKRLFAQVERLLRLQLVVFPTSEIHWSESIVTPYHNELSQLSSHLSGGVSFRSKAEIEDSEFIAALRAWLRGTPPALPAAKDGLEGNIDGWMHRLHMSTRYNDPIPDLQADVKNATDRDGIGITALNEIWSQSRGANFETWYAYELGSVSRVLIGDLAKVFRYLSALERGDEPTEKPSKHSYFYRCYELAMWILAQEGIPEADRVKRFSEFVRSEAIKNMPSLRVGGYMHAKLAFRAANYKDTKPKPPNRGTFNDIRMVEAYWPFCGAMYLDKKNVRLLDGYRSRDCDFKVELFARSTGEGFITYLQEIESSATSEHIAKVVEIYGSDFLESNWKMFT